jgi:hypothetical protein
MLALIFFNAELLSYFSFDSSGDIYSLQIISDFITFHHLKLHHHIILNTEW